MKIPSLILLILVSGQLPAQNSVKLGGSAGLNYSGSRHNYVNYHGLQQQFNSGTLDIVISPGIFVHKSWGNFGLYSPFPITIAFKRLGFVGPFVYYLPINAEVGIHPGNPDMTIHMGYGYSVSVLSAINGVYNKGMHELNTGYQYKRFDSRIGLGLQHAASNDVRTRISFGLFYYLRK